MSEALKELLEPEIIKLKVYIADQDAKLADKDNEIEKLKSMLAKAGIEV